MALALSPSPSPIVRSRALLMCIYLFIVRCSVPFFAIPLFGVRWHIVRFVGFILAVNDSIAAVAVDLFGFAWFERTTHFYDLAACDS